MKTRLWTNNSTYSILQKSNKSTTEVPTRKHVYIRTQSLEDYLVDQQFQQFLKKNSKSTTEVAKETYT